MLFKKKKKQIHIDPNSLMIKDISSTFRKNPIWAIISNEFNRTIIIFMSDSYKDCLKYLWNIKDANGFDIEV